MRIGLFDITGNIDENAAIDFQLQCRTIPVTKKNIAAIIVRINSQGGSLGPAQAMVEAIEIVRLETGLPWICVITDLALSAGLYVAQASDHIVATPGCMLGGIGSIYKKYDLGKLVDLLGIRSEHVSPNTLKDFSDTTRDLSNEKREMLLEFCEDQSSQFVDYIKKRRVMASTHIDKLAMGGIITGAHAKDMNLIDSHGSLLSAIKISCEIADINTAHILHLGQASHGRGVIPWLLRLARSLLSRF